MMRGWVSWKTYSHDPDLFLGRRENTPLKLEQYRNMYAQFMESALLAMHDSSFQCSFKQNTRSICRITTVDNWTASSRSPPRQVSEVAV